MWLSKRNTSQEFDISGMAIQRWGPSNGSYKFSRPEHSKRLSGNSPISHHFFGRYDKTIVIPSKDLHDKCLYPNL